MSFPPNLGITNSFIIDSSCILFNEFPSLLPQLDQITSPFNKHRMNGYSRIKKSAANRSKSLDFSELSLCRSTPTITRFIKSQQTTPDICRSRKVHDSIPEHDDGEVFVDIIGRTKCGGVADRNVEAEQVKEAVKGSFSVKRSASISDGYSRIHHLSVDDGDQCREELIGSHKHGKCVKKKGKLYRAFRRLFGL